MVERGRGSGPEQTGWMLGLLRILCRGHNASLSLGAENLLVVAVPTHQKNLWSFRITSASVEHAGS